MPVHALTHHSVPFVSPQDLCLQRDNFAEAVLVVVCEA